MARLRRVLTRAWSFWIIMTVIFQVVLLYNCIERMLVRNNLAAMLRCRVHLRIFEEGWRALKIVRFLKRSLHKRTIHRQRSQASYLRQRGKGVIGKLSPNHEVRVIQTKKPWIRNLVIQYFFQTVEWFEYTTTTVSKVTKIERTVIKAGFFSTATKYKECKFVLNEAKV